MPVNLQAEIDEARFLAGSVASANLLDSNIDQALTESNDEVTERTGMDSTSTYLPNLRRKMKILVAVADLLIPFKNSSDIRDSILKEIENVETRLTNPHPNDPDSESLVDSAGYQSYPLNINGSYYSGVKRRFIPRGYEGLGSSVFIGI